MFIKQKYNARTISSVRVDRISFLWQIRKFAMKVWGYHPDSLGPGKILETFIFQNQTTFATHFPQHPNPSPSLRAPMTRLPRSSRGGPGPLPSVRRPGSPLESLFAALTRHGNSTRAGDRAKVMHALVPLRPPTQGALALHLLRREAGRR